ncbi:MAG: RNA polymerase sigma factor [Clostridia bacterium]|nr:RNA polymerase sigma factor [Clostridia bacterium]
METEKLAALVLAAQNGEENAATALYDAYQKDLYYHIYKTVNDHHLAEDLLQDAFIEILGTIQNLKEPASFLSWSKQIAYHKCTAYFKRRRDILADENEDGLSIFDTIEEENAEFIPDEALDKADLKQTINQMIDELPEEQRSALMLRYFDEISVKEIAEIQGVTEGTVKSRLNYGRKAIKEAVEGYEKKHGIKLRCAGVIPLLLWLFREISISNGISLTSSTASATYAAANAAANAVTEGVKAEAKTAGKFAAKKLIAGITAATVVAGGVGAAVLLKPEPDPMIWSGYGVENSTNTRRFEITIEEMNDTNIIGNLEVSYLYETVNDIDFIGTGIENGNEIIYTLNFEEPLKTGTTIKYKYKQLEVTYDKSDDEFSFNQHYNAELERQTKEKSKVLFENENWSGIGKDGFYKANKTQNHLFELNIQRLTEEDISGILTISYDGKIDHNSTFTGRGYEKKGIIYYEILLETPRTKKNLLGDITLDRFWLQYDLEKETFEIPFGILYRVVMDKK